MERAVVFLGLDYCCGVVLPVPPDPPDDDPPPEEEPLPDEDPLELDEPPLLELPADDAPPVPMFVVRVLRSCAGS